MPELPEVETVRRTLASGLQAAVITDVEVRSDDVIALPGPEDFCRRLIDKRFGKIGRRGKYLLMHLTEAGSTAGVLRPTDWVLVTHLRMTGRLVLAEPEQSELPHTHVIVALSNGHQLRFSDVRRFGRLYLFPATQLPVALLRQAQLLDQQPRAPWGPVDNGQPSAAPGLFKLGPEPLSEEFTVDYLAHQLRRRGAPVKAVLLDQRVVAGLGNIYVDEALFRASVHPGIPARNLTGRQLEKLVAGIKQVLTEAIADRGTTFSDYRDGSGQPGQFQRRLQVFSRSGQPCRKCGTPVQKTRLAGRGTHFCPTCQPT